MSWTDPATGRLLVATHDLTDPNFAGAVVLLLDHDEEGSVGVVLNRPGETPVLQRLHEVAQPAVVFLGGPVRRDLLITLGVGASIDGEMWQPVMDGLGVVDVDRDPPPALRGIRAFSGHAGWGPGQLDREVAEGAWWVVEGTADDAVDDRPEALWRQVLIRQGGLFTTVPEDPVLN